MAVPSQLLHAHLSEADRRLSGEDHALEVRVFSDVRQAHDCQLVGDENGVYARSIEPTESRRAEGQPCGEGLVDGLEGAINQDANPIELQHVALRVLSERCELHVVPGKQGGWGDG